MKFIAINSSECGVFYICYAPTFLDFSKYKVSRKCGRLCLVHVGTVYLNFTLI